MHTAPAWRRLAPDEAGWSADLPDGKDGDQGRQVVLLADRLTPLPWVRVDVDIRDMRAHGLIILKGSRDAALLPILGTVVARFAF